MLLVEWSDQAELDIAEIWHYIAGDSIAAADRLLAAIREAARDLAEFPMLGRAREEFGPEVRGVVKYPYLILYRVRDNRVGIARVVHGSRNLDEIWIV